ncbi:MAG: sigma-70 family RNA polymerase sigma factor [Candidatus Dormibacteraceae bacterium]
MPDRPGPARAAPHGEDSFDRLFLAEYGRVVAIAQRVVDDRTEAEDVAQEVFWDLHRRDHTGKSYARAWLYKAAAHTALNRVRSRKRREKRELTTFDRAAAAPDPSQLVEQQEQREEVRTALQRLSRKSASVLVLRYSGLSYVEVAQALGVGTNQIGTLLRRAEQALRKEMRDASSV